MILKAEHQVTRSDGVGSGQKRKEKVDNFNEEVGNVVVALSDEDDGNDAKKTCKSLQTMKLDNSLQIGKPHIPLALTEPMSSTMAISRSEFRRTGNGQASMIGTSLGTGYTQIAKKIFVTPSPTPVASQLRTEYQHTATHSPKPPSTSGRGRNRLNERHQALQRMSASILPRGIKWRFRPTNGMHLAPLELYLCAYVFLPNQDTTEVILRSRGVFGIHSEFISLCPGKNVSEEIITMVAEKTLWVLKILNTQAVWIMPPAFSEDVYFDRALYQLMEAYAEEWMEPYTQLKYIYVPIKTSKDHWYLMVISPQEEIVYHLDSYLEVNEIGPRRVTISTLSNVLSQMVSSPHFVFGRSVNFVDWKIKEARGIPNCGHSDNSAVWLLEWLDMEDDFQPNLTGTLQENAMRMRTAMVIAWSEQ